MERYHIVFDEKKNCYMTNDNAAAQPLDVSDFERMLDPEHMLQHLYIGLQRRSSQNILKRRTVFPGVEKYIYYRLGRARNSCFIMKLKYDMMTALRIDEKLAWTMAAENTSRETVIENVADIIGRLCGFAPGVNMDGPQIYCVTNRERNRGAAGILETGRIRAFAREHGADRLIVLPSSIHEMLIIPDFEGAEIESFDRMVREVNANEVPVDEQLSDRAYTLDFSS